MTATVRRILASVLAWIVGAGAAVGVGLLALSLIDDGLTAPPSAPLRVAADTSEPPRAHDASPGGAGTQARPAASTGDRLISSPGGTAVVRCGDAGAYLVTWIPDPGYRAEEVRRGPGPSVSVEFESSGRRYLLSARCVGGIPEPRVAQLEDGGHRDGRH